MAKNTVQRKALELIYTLFVGILVAVFVGVGIAAFYPEPNYPDMPPELKVLRTPGEQGVDDASESADLIEQQRLFDAQLDAHQVEIETYNRNVSIIALIAAVIVLVISLTTFKNLQVIADGLLLGGVITLLYSVVRIFGSGDDKVRFLVVGVGLVVALTLGYIKFIKEK